MCIRDSGKAFDRLRNGMTTMRYGLDCYSYGLLASGHLDIAMDPGLQIYDIAALIPIMTGAGAAISSWSGNDPSNGGNIIAASSQSLLDEALRTMQGATG